MVDSAAEALISSLPEEERTAVRESTATTDDSPVEHNEAEIESPQAIPESDKLKNKVFEFGQEAIKGKQHKNNSFNSVLSSLFTSHKGWCHGLV